MTTIGPNYVVDAIEIPAEPEAFGWGDIPFVFGAPDEVHGYAFAASAPGVWSNALELDFKLDPHVLRRPVGIVAEFALQALNDDIDFAVQLAVNGTLIGNPKTVTVPQSEAFGHYIFGSSADNWGAELNGIDAADVRLRIQIRGDDPEFFELDVEHGRLTLTDTDPPPARRSRLTRVKRLQRFFRV